MIFEKKWRAKIHLIFLIWHISCHWYILYWTLNSKLQYVFGWIFYVILNLELKSLRNWRVCTNRETKIEESKEVCMDHDVRCSIISAYPYWDPAWRWSWIDIYKFSWIQLEFLFDSLYSYIISWKNKNIEIRAKNVISALSPRRPPLKLSLSFMLPRLLLNGYVLRS